MYVTDSGYSNTNISTACNEQLNEDLQPNVSSNASNTVGGRLRVVDSTSMVQTVKVYTEKKLVDCPSNLSSSHVRTWVHFILRFSQRLALSRSNSADLTRSVYEHGDRTVSFSATLYIFSRYR